MSSDRLMEDFDAGKPAALARVVSIVENHRDGFEQLLGLAAPANGPGAAHRNDRAAGRRQEHDHGASGEELSRSGAHGRRHRRRSDVAVHRRRAARRSHSDGERRARSRASSSGRWRRAARSAGSPRRRARSPTCSTRSASIGFSSRPSAWGRSSSTSRAPRTRPFVVLVPGIGRLDPDAQGGPDGDRRHLRREQGRSARRRSVAQRRRADARPAQRRDARQRAGASRRRSQAPCNPAAAARRESAASRQSNGMDAAGAPRRRHEAGGNRRDHRRRSTVTSLILSRAERCARGGAQRLRERVMDVVERKVSDRLWKDAAHRTWLEEQLPSVEAGHRDTVRRRGPAASPERRARTWRTEDMTKLKSPGSESAADSELIATIEEQSAELRLCARRSQRGARGTRRESCATSPSPTRRRKSSRSTRRSTSAETDAEALGVPGFYPVHARQFIRPGIAASCGRCASSPASAARATRTSATSSCSRTGRPDSRSRSISRR